jgi:hypothetical protein
MAGPESLTLIELIVAVHFGAQRWDDALRFLRQSGLVVEGRRGTEGFDLDRIVLRAKL